MDHSRKHSIRFLRLPKGRVRSRKLSIRIRYDSLLLPVVDELLQLIFHLISLRDQTGQGLAMIRILLGQSSQLPFKSWQLVLNIRLASQSGFDEILATLRIGNHDLLFQLGMLMIKPCHRFGYMMFLGSNTSQRRTHLIDHVINFGYRLLEHRFRGKPFYF